MRYKLILICIFTALVFTNAFAMELSYYDKNYSDLPQIIKQVDFSDIDSLVNADIEADAENGNTLKIRAGKSVSFISNNNLDGGVYKLSFEAKLLNNTDTYQYVQLRNGNEYCNTYRIHNDKMGFFRSKNTWTISDFCRTANINKWATVDMIINLDKGKIDYYINNEYLYSMSYSGFEKITDIIFCNASESQNVLFDNMKLEQVFGERAESLAENNYRIDNYLKPIPVRMEVTTERTGNIFDDRNITKFNLEFYNRGQNTETVKLSYCITDKKSKTKIKEQTLDTFTISKNEIKNTELDVNVGKYGIYCIDFTLEISGKSVVERKEFSICNTSDIDNEEVGINLHLSRRNWFGNDTVTEIGKITDLLGVKYARGNIIDSQNIERDSDGLYKSFSEIPEDQTAYEGATADRGILPVQTLILGYGENNAPPITDEELDNFYQYVFDYVLKYKDKVKCWEIWNEYNLPAHNTSNVMSEASKTNDYSQVAKCYVKMLEKAYTAAKAADNDCIVAGMAAASSWTGTNTYKGIDFVRDVLEEGGGQYMDVLSYHYYGAPVPKPEDSGIISELRNVKRNMEQNGCGEKELWLTETGFSSAGGRYAISPNYEVNDYTQAKYFITELAALKTYGSADKVMLYLLHDKDITTFYETGFGITRSYSDVNLPFAAKPAYLAIANWNKLMNGAIAQGVISSSDGNERVYRYSVPTGDDLLVIYTAGQGKSELKLNLGCLNGVIYDIYGNETQTESENGVFEFTVSDEPIYFKGKLKRLNIEGISRPENSIILYSENFEKDYSGGFPDRWKYGSAENAYCFDRAADNTALSFKKTVKGKSSEYPDGTPVRTQINMRNYKISGDEVCNISMDFMIPSESVMNNNVHYVYKLSDADNSSAYLLRIKDGKIRFYNDMTKWNGYHNDKEISIVPGTWYTLKAKINMKAKNAEVSVDNVSAIGTFEEESFDCMFIIAENVTADSEAEAQICVDNLLVSKETQIANIGLLIDGEAIDDGYCLSGGECITAYADIIGAGSIDKENMRIILALYKNNLLAEVKASPINSMIDNSISITMPDNILPNDNYSIRAYVWDNMRAMSSVYEM